MTGCHSETGAAWCGRDEEGSGGVAMGWVSRHQPADLLAMKDSYPGLKQSYDLQ